MNLKLKAFIQTIFIILGIFAMGFAMPYLFAMIPDAAIPYIGLGILVSLFGYLIYSINLSRLEVEENLRKSFDRNL